MIHFKWYKFAELTGEEIYSILALRAEVFIVEQKICYLDLDKKDFCALHLLGFEKKKLVAYSRLFLPDEKNVFLIFGRVVTAKSVRRKGYGKLLMKTILDFCNEKFPSIPIKCSAQLYLKKFYESFGFKTCGESYDEDGILHIAMQKTNVHN